MNVLNIHCIFSIVAGERDAVELRIGSTSQIR